MKPTFHSNDFTFRPTMMASALKDAFEKANGPVSATLPLVREAVFVVRGETYHPSNEKAA